MSYSVTPWTVDCQAPLPMGFSRQEYWSGLPCPPPGDLPNPGIKPTFLTLLHWKVGSLPLMPQPDPSVRIQFSSVAQSCPALCDPMNHTTPGLPVHHQLPEFTQTHVHQVGDAIQPSHPLSSEVIDISPGNLDSSLCFFQTSVSHDVLCIEVK